MKNGKKQWKVANLTVSLNPFTTEAVRDRKVPGYVSYIEMEANLPYMRVIPIVADGSVRRFDATKGKDVIERNLPMTITANGKHIPVELLKESSTDLQVLWIEEPSHNSAINLETLYETVEKFKQAFATRATQTAHAHA